jgi:hypothetical protein
MLVCSVICGELCWSALLYVANYAGLLCYMWRTMLVCSVICGELCWSALLYTKYLRLPTQHVVDHLYALRTVTVF